MFQRPIRVGARRSRVLAMSFGAFFAVFAAVATAVVFSGSVAQATTYTLTSTTPVTNWSDVLRWNGGTGTTYPGQNPGDTVSIPLSGMTLNIDVTVPNPVQLNITTFAPVTIPAAGSLTLAGGSSATSSNTFTINGGTLGVDSAANLSSWQGPITLNTGTFNVAGSLAFAAGSSFNFNGGTLQGGGTLTIPLSHSAQFTGSSGAMTMSNVTFDNFGTTTYNSAANALTIASGAVLKNESGGTFNYSTAQPINTNNVGSPKINNIGSLNVLPGNSPTINCSVDNSGTISLADTGSSQLLNLLGGGTHSGMLTNANSGSMFVFGGGTHNLNPGTSFGGTANVALTGGTVNVNTSGLILTYLKQSSGSLSGTSSLLAGQFDWLGGTITGQGAGVTVNTTGNITSGATTLTNAAALINNGTVHYQPTSAMAVNTGGTINNYGTWQFENGIGMTSDLTLFGGTQAPQFFNFGTVSKTVAGQTLIGAPFTSSGPITLNNGADLELGAGATLNGGVINLSTSADVLGFPSGFSQIPVSSTVSFTGPGVVRLDGTGFLTDSKGLTLANFELGNGATLSEAATLTVTNVFKTTGGVIGGGGALTLNNGATGDLTSLASNLSLQNATFNNGGTITYNPTFPIEFQANAQFNNLSTGILNITGPGGTSTIGTPAGFNNQGTINRSGAPTFFTFDVPFTNSGNVNVNAASNFVAFSNGGTMTTGAMQGTVASAGVEFSGGTFNVQGGSFGTVGGVKINGGTLNVTSNLSAPASFALLSGTLTGTGTTTLPSGSTGQINGGTILNTTLIAASGSTLNFDTTSVAGAVNGSAVNVSSGATANWTGTNSLALTGAGALTNAGTFNLNSDATLTSAAPITNTGLFRKAAGTGTSTIQAQLVNNGSAIAQVQTGTMAFAGGGSLNGGSSFIVNNSTTAQFSGGTFDFNAGTVSSLGTWSLTGATVNINFLVSTGFLNMTGGSLNVPTSQTLTIGGNTTLNGGTITGAGVTQMNNPSGSVTIGGTTTTLVTNGQTFRNYGSTVYNGSATNGLRLTNGGVFENEVGATFTGTQDGGVFGDALSTFRNFGTVTRSGGTFTEFDVPFVNGGTVNAVPGRIVFNNGGSSTGSLGAGASSALEFGAGTFQVTGGTMPFSGGSSLKMTGGTLQLNIAPSGSPQLLMSNGTLNDNAGLTFAGGTWSGGTINGIASTQNSGTLTLDGTSSTASLASHTLTNSGTINYAPGTFSLSLDNGSTLTNAASGTFDIQNGTAIVSTGAASSINNAGTLKKTAGTPTSISANLNNSGTVLASSGTMTFNNFTQTAGVTTLGPGSVGAPTLTFSGGTLGGSGSLVGNVSVGNAAVSPGTGVTPGAITVNGNYSQSGGTFNARLAGTGASNFDHVDATGSVTLSGGTLNVSFLGAYTPASGNTFDVLTYSSASGDFATKNLPTFPAGGSMNFAYLTNALRLTALVTQADVQTTQSGPSTVLHNQNDVITITVSNLGTTPANSVTLSDTFGGAAFVSANASQGSCAAPSGSTFTCSLGTLNGTSSATITLTLNANAVGTITNHAVSSSTTFDPNTANNDTANTTPYSASSLASSDIGLAVTDSPDPTPASGTVTYTVAVANAGPDTSGTIPVTVTLTGGTIVGTTATGPCSPAGANTYNCTVSSLTSGGSSNISVLTTASNGTSMQLTATSGYAQDPNNANNSASQSTTINASADLSITKSGPASAAAGTVVTYVITVTNNGPSTATSIVIADTAPSRLQVVTISSSTGCTSFPCNVASLAAGSSVTITAQYKVTAGGPATITNTAIVSATTQDANAANNTANASTQLTCSTQTPQISGATTGVPTSGTITWSNAGYASYNVYFGKKGAACSLATPTATVSGTSYNYSGLDPNTDYEIRVEGVTNGCPNVSSSCFSFKTGVNCSLQPVPTSPSGTTIGSPVHFTWTSVPGATQYEVFVSNGAVATSLGTTGGTSFDANVNDGPASWFVVATVPGCGTVTGPSATFNVCNDPIPPAASVVAQAASGQKYAVQWDAIPGATKYEIDEAQNAQFTGATTQTVTTTTVNFLHAAQTAPQAYYYRVRAFGGCKQQFGAYSSTLRIVIVPIPRNQQNSNVNIPAGSTTPVTQEIFVPGLPEGNFNFFATGDKPWITVTPSSGVLTPNGITLQVSANPADLPNGTFTATVLLTLTPLSLANGAHVTASTSVSVPVSVSLVTPVLPTSATSSTNSLVIPSVGHLDGLDSHWQSDIRVANTSNVAQKYTLTFNPSDNSGVKTTTITIDGGATTALDDIVKNWYGIGALGEAANGVLQITPQTLGQQLTSTVASSRTYNVGSTGTLGQFIPAVPFGNFIGIAQKGLPSILSLQQISQNAQYRTNFGVVEASGQPANVLLSIFDASGAKLKDIPVNIGAFQQLQLNSMLATNGIATLNDGRVEAKVISGSGKVTAYASVVDNNTQDPLLVSGVPLGASTSKDYVLPGVADLNSPFASWRTDMRVFNSGTSAQTASVTFYPLGNAGAPQATTLSINPGEVKTIDNTLQTLFGSAAANLGGAIHISTLNDSSLVVTGRTFNKTDTGTYGQFIPAITPADAVGTGGRVLQILQVEDSPRYRTNLGIAEVTGKPATVEVTIILPDSRVSPRIEIPLAANEYRQESIISSLGLGNVYNARIAIRVTSGEGKVSAYGSVIDRQTQDPTYVPAQ